MTIVPALQPISALSFNRDAQKEIIEVAPGERVLVHCNLLPEKSAPCLLIVHGLESSSSSPYVVGLARKAMLMGFQSARMNLRNCGDTLHLSSTLYNGGLSGDVLAVLHSLRTFLPAAPIFLVGYSLGGNIVLKATAELAASARGLVTAVCAISPPICLSSCVEAINLGLNHFYETRFLQGLKEKVRAKAKLFPDRYDLTRMAKVTTLRQFDDTYTAPDGGYLSAQDYYDRASALPLLDKIEVPALIITAQDDPIVPFSSFRSDKLSTGSITLLAPTHGGHGGFLSNKQETASEGGITAADDRWAENRVIQFCLHHM